MQLYIWLSLYQALLLSGYNTSANNIYVGDCGNCISIIPMLRLFGLYLFNLFYIPVMTSNTWK